MCRISFMIFFVFRLVESRSGCLLLLVFLFFSGLQNPQQKRMGNCCVESEKSLRPFAGRQASSTWPACLFLGNFPWALRRGKACLDVVEPPSLNDFSECRRQRVGIFTEGRRRRRRKTSYLSRLIFPWEVLPGCVSVRAKKGS